MPPPLAGLPAPPGSEAPARSPDRGTSVPRGSGQPALEQGWPHGGQNGDQRPRAGAMPPGPSCASQCHRGPERGRRIAAAHGLLRPRSQSLEWLDPGEPQLFEVDASPDLTWHGVVDGAFTAKWDQHLPTAGPTRRARAGRRSPRRPSRGLRWAPRGGLAPATRSTSLTQGSGPLRQRFGPRGSDRLVSHGRPGPSSQGAPSSWHRSRTRLGHQRAGTWRRSRPAMCRRRSSPTTTRGSAAQASR